MNRMLWPVIGLVVIAAGVGGFFMFPWTRPADSHANGDKFADPNSRPPAEKGAEPKGDQFGADRKGQVPANEFDAKRSMEYLVALCKLGPRISGSESMTKQQELLEKHFEKHGGKVTWQKFDGKQPSQKQAVPMANMIISWNPEAKRRVMFCGHYDTRPIADQEARRADWTKRFDSANDGTSTVALLMEMAHHMKDLPRKVGIDFVIFDGEEFIYEPDRDRFFLGSNFFADAYAKDKQREYTYIAAILMDLFAGKNPTYPAEGYSLNNAGGLVEDIWKEAKMLGVTAFEWREGGSVQDDHLALQRVKIPAIDIIDFDYKHWHKLTDVPENCSGDSMADVARVLMSWVQRVK